MQFARSCTGASSPNEVPSFTGDLSLIAGRIRRARGWFPPSARPHTIEDTLTFRKWLLLSLIVATIGCKGKPGDRCSGAGECDGRDKALLCGLSAKYVNATCKGPDGCTASPFRCDFRENAAGDPCSDGTGSHPMHCTADTKARVRCVGGKVDRDACEGPLGCYRKSETTMGCDRALKAGATCTADGDWCSTDGKEWLTCKEGKLVIAAKCRGPGACKPFGDAVACDVSIAEVADECAGSGHACSVDKTKVLSCAAGKLKVEKACAQGKSCRSSSDGVSCEGQ